MTPPPRKSFAFEDLELGMSAHLDRTVAAGDVAAFAEISGDFNPIHLDAAYAAATMFGGCITHGMLTASYISAVFAMELPGPGAVYIAQTLNFRGPVRVGDMVRTRVTVVELLAAKRRVRFACECMVADRAVLSGEATLMVHARLT